MTEQKKVSLAKKFTYFVLPFGFMVFFFFFIYCLLQLLQSFNHFKNLRSMFYKILNMFLSSVCPIYDFCVVIEQICFPKKIFSVDMQGHLLFLFRCVQTMLAVNVSFRHVGQWNVLQSCFVFKVDMTQYIQLTKLQYLMCPIPYWERKH